MNTTSADGVIVGSLIAVGAISIAKGAKAGHINFVRIGIGVIGVGVGLGVVATFAPKLAAAFAGLIALGAALPNTGVINDATTALFGSTSSAVGVSTANATVAPNTTIRQT